MKRTALISTRIPPDLRARLDAIHAKHLTTDSAVGLALYSAFCDYVEHTGKVEMPVAIIPASHPKAKSA